MSLHTFHCRDRVSRTWRCLCFICSVGGIAPLTNTTSDPAAASLVVGRWDDTESPVCDESHLSLPPLSPQLKHVSLRLPRRPRCRPDASHVLKPSKHHVDSINPLSPRGFLPNRSNCHPASPPPANSSHRRHAPRFQRFPPKERELSASSRTSRAAGSSALISHVSACFERWSWIKRAELQPIFSCSCPRTISAEEFGNQSTSKQFTVHLHDVPCTQSENRAALYTFISTTDQMKLSPPLQLHGALQPLLAPYFGFVAHLVLWFDSNESQNLKFP